MIKSLADARRVDTSKLNGEILPTNIEYADVLSAEQREAFLNNVSEKVAKALQDKPFRFDNKDQVKETLFKEELQQVYQLAGNIVKTFYEYLPEKKGRSYKAIIFVDELDSLFQDHSACYSAAFTYLFLHMADGVMSKKPCQMLGAGRLPNLLQVCKSQHFVTHHDFAHGSPTRGMTLMTMDTLELSHVEAILDKIDANVIPKDAISICAEVVQEVTQGVPRFVVWAIFALEQAYRATDVSSASDLINTVLQTSPIKDYAMRIEFYIQSHPLPFLTLATASVLGCRLNPQSHMDTNGSIFTSEASNTRPIVDWCKFFNFYVDTNKFDELITLRTPRILSASLAKYTTFYLVPAATVGMSLPQVELYKQRENLIRSCFGKSAPAQGDTANTPSKEAVTEALKSNLPTSLYEVSASSVAKGLRFEDAVFRLLHLRLIEFAECWGDEKPISAVLPFPHSRAYNPRLVKVACLPKIMVSKKQSSPIEDVWSTVESLMTPYPFKDYSNLPTVQIHCSNFGTIAEKMEDNVLWMCAPASSSGDMYLTLGDSLFAFNKKYEEKPLTLLQLAREMRKALPESLINSDRFTGKSKYFVSLCATPTEMNKVLKDNEAKKMVGGWYVEGPKTIQTSNDEEPLVIRKDCTLICLDRKETALTFSHFIGQTKECSLGGYYRYKAESYNKEATAIGIESKSSL